MDSFHVSVEQSIGYSLYSTRKVSVQMTYNNLTSLKEVLPLI